MEQLLTKFFKNFGAKIVMGTFSIPETVYKIVCKNGLIKLIIRLIKNIF